MRQDRQERFKNVTQVTEYRFCKKSQRGEAPPVRSFHDGFDAIGGANQRDIRATVGE